MDNVIKFRKDKDTYYKIAKKRREDGDLIGALSCLFSSLKAEFSLDAVKEIADIYSQMCIYELSNKYWYLYLSKAPKNRKAEAYEGLGVNYFLSDDVKTGNYYFDLRAKHDGLEESAFVSESIIEKLQDFYNYNSPIRLVYPPESADFNEELFKGKFALSRLEGKTAIEFFSAIPKGSKQYGESRDGIATAYYLCGDFDSGIKVLKETIAEEGENTGNLCKLSQFYKAKSEEGDNKNYYAEKSKYYYEKARDLGDKDMADVYKLAFSSFEHGDDKTALYCMEKIIVEREYDINMYFYYAVSLLNNGQWEKAYDKLNYVRRIYPYSDVINYYADAVGELLRTGCDKNKLIPVKYRFSIPQKEIDKRVKEITRREIKNGENKIGKDKKLLSYLEWGLNSHEKEIEDLCAFFLMYSDYEGAVSLLKDKLLDPFCDNDLKRSIIYYLIMCGEQEKIPCVVNKIFITMKPQDLACGHAGIDNPYFSGYAIALPTVAFLGYSSLEKIGHTADAVYKKFVSFKTKIRTTREEICALIIYLCNFKGLSEEKTVCALLDVKEKTLKKLIERYKGENND